MAAVAAYAWSTGGLVPALMGFLIFGLTMGFSIFSVGLLGAKSSAQLAKSLRYWSHWVQAGSAWVIILVGLLLIYAGTNPGVFDRLILR